jgi:hypothetical protein
MRCYAKLHTTMAVFDFKAHASTKTKGTPQGVPFVLTKSKKAMNLANPARDLPPHARTPNCDTHRICAYAGVQSPASSSKKQHYFFTFVNLY